MWHRCCGGLLACLFAFLVVIGPAAAADGLVPLPPLTARVTDLAGALPADAKAALEQQLAAFEARQGSQVAVLLLPTTQPETIEQFGIRLFDAWKIGRKGVDDGALLIIAKDDRRLRIEVGYGLEGALNDATAKRIISEVITPHLKAGDFAGGVSAGVAAMLKVIAGESLPPPAAARAAATGSSLGDLPEGAIFGIMIAVVLGGSLIRRLFGNLFGSALVGSITGGIGWLIVGGLFGIVGGAVLGIFLSLFGLDILRSGVLSGGGGRSGGGFGGGGFGGGGGSGGGGGASGSW